MPFPRWEESGSIPLWAESSERVEVRAVPRSLAGDYDRPPLFKVKDPYAFFLTRDSASDSEWRSRSNADPSARQSASGLRMIAGGGVGPQDDSGEASGARMTA